MRTTRPTAGGRRRSRLLAGFAAAAALVVTPVVTVGSTATSEAAAPAVARLDATTPPFRVASFNVLGHSHTAKGGNRPGWLGSRQRMNRTVKILDRRAIDVVGLQEFQQQQYDKFRELVGGSWGVYPGDQLSHMAMQNSIAWRSSEWTLVEARTVQIPYFFGDMVPMPYVLLRNNETHRMVWFANFHNPTDGGGRGSQKKWRDMARNREIRLANRLWNTGLPVIVTGDMNESSVFYCAMASGAPMKAPNGGSATESSCKPPALRGIDWIMGSVDLQFANFTMHNGPFVRRTSDHPVLYSDVTVPARPVG